MDITTEDGLAKIFFGEKGNSDWFMAQAFAIITKNGPDRFRLLRELIANYSSKIPSKYSSFSYDHKIVENISKSLIALTISDKDSNAWLEFFAEPFDESSNQNDHQTIATEKIIGDATHYYTLGLILGILQSSNWLDKNWTTNVLAEKIPDTLAKIIFCLNKLTEFDQINERYESELAKATKPFLRDTLYFSKRVSMLMESIYKPITQLKNASTFGLLIVEQLNYAIFGAFSFLSRIDSLAMYWQKLNKK